MRSSKESIVKIHTMSCTWSHDNRMFKLKGPSKSHTHVPTDIEICRYLTTNPSDIWVVYILVLLFFQLPPFLLLLFFSFPFLVSFPKNLLYISYVPDTMLGC